MVADAAPSSGSIEPIWRPSPEVIAHARLTAFSNWLTQTGRRPAVVDYRHLWDWSIEHQPDFWSAVWDYFEVGATSAPTPALADSQMPGATWFPDASLNYVDQVLKFGQRAGAAIIEESEPEGGGPRTITWPELVRQIGAVADTLRRLGVVPGDRVVGYLPNIAETVIAFLATASLGAIWSACGQDYAPAAAAARLGQLEPRVLVAADGYRYAGKSHDRRNEVAELRHGLPTLQNTILVSRLGLDWPADETTLAWSTASAGNSPLTTNRVAFDHPLWVLFSSGTTGKPKGIVHGHGGVLLEHLKAATFHLDLGPGDTYFWYTSPSWMMWNFQVAGLLVGASIVCYDGSPGYPESAGLWALAARHRVSVLGTSAAFLQAGAKAGERPCAEHDLSMLRILGATGSTLPAPAYYWAHDAVGAAVQLVSISGGTDVVTAFAGGARTVPVWPGELSVPCLGVALDAWDADGRSVRDEVGELVVTQPMPSMPLGFWADPDGSRYRAAYFEQYPGVWRHGDWITITSRGSVVMHGRSDSTLNRNGIRMGSAEIYDAIEQLPEIRESLIVGVEQPDGRYWMPLFVELAESATLGPELIDRIRRVISDNVSARHVPDDILAAPGIPHTKTGKKLEIPVKRLLQGVAVDVVADADSVDQPQLLTWFAAVQRD